MIEKSSPIPLYCQIKAKLERDIDSGKLVPGDRMPSEMELAAEHRVSRTTARQALQKLCEAGLVTRIQGKGTFVRQIGASGSDGAATGALERADGPISGALRPRRALRARGETCTP